MSDCFKACVSETRKAFEEKWAHFIEGETGLYEAYDVFWIRKFPGELFFSTDGRFIRVRVPLGIYQKLIENLQERG
jgi:hypothetical protein